MIHGCKRQTFLETDPGTRGTRTRVPQPSTRAPGTRVYTCNCPGNNVPGTVETGYPGIPTRVQRTRAPGYRSMCTLRVSLFYPGARVPGYYYYVGHEL
eukprot:3033159-Rhodomonas_salina.1